MRLATADRRLQSWRLMVFAIVLTACTQGGGGRAASSPSAVGPAATQAACAPASEDLRSFLERGLAVRGATLSHMADVPATQPELRAAGGADPFAQGWWVAARITGAGIRPEVIAWLVATLQPSSPDEVVPANATARRDWSAVSGGGDLRGEGLDTAMSCVGPIPPV